MKSARPQSGVDAETALKLWTEPLAHQRMVEYSDAYRTMSTADGGTRFLESRKRRQIVEDELSNKLKEGKVIASAVERYGCDREVIDPTLWPVLEINYELGDIDGEVQHYRNAEFFEPKSVPLNIVNLPTWLNSSKLEVEFEHDADFRHVRLGKYKFNFGVIQARVIQKLFEARRVDDGWRAGKSILYEAGSVQASMTQVFKKQKNWKKLIETDPSGLYRLTVSIEA